jgi:general secretion pathway protein I
MKVSRRLRAQGGFSLLEAIVAMVLIAGAGMALFSWISSSINSLASLEEVNRRSEATLNILEYMETVNPMLAPEGEEKLGSYSIRWRSSPATPVVDGVDHPRGVGLYQVALYRIEVWALTDGNKPWFDLELRQVGYKRVRSPAGA